MKLRDLQKKKENWKKVARNLKQKITELNDFKQKKYNFLLKKRLRSFKV